MRNADTSLRKEHAAKLRRVGAWIAATRIQGWANPMVSDLSDAADYLDPRPALSGEVVLSKHEAGKGTAG